MNFTKTIDTVTFGLMIPRKDVKCAEILKRLCWNKNIIFIFKTTQ